MPRRDIALHKPLVRCVAHDYINRPANSIALLTDNQGFIDFEPVQELRRKNIERHVAVPVVGTGDFYAIDQRVVVAFVHAAQNGKLPVAVGIALDRNARHALNDVGAVRSGESSIVRLNTMLVICGAGRSKSRAVRSLAPSRLAVMVTSVSSQAFSDSSEISTVADWSPVTRTSWLMVLKET